VALNGICKCLLGQFAVILFLTLASVAVLAKAKKLKIFVGHLIPGEFFHASLHLVSNEQGLVVGAASFSEISMPVANPLVYGMERSEYQVGDRRVGRPSSWQCSVLYFRVDGETTEVTLMSSSPREEAIGLVKSKLDELDKATEKIKKTKGSGLNND